MQANLRWTRQVDHANTTGLVLCFGTMTFIWLRQPDQVLAAAREAIAFAEEMTLPLWHAWGRTQLGWALSQSDAAGGIPEMEAGIEEAVLVVGRRGTRIVTEALRKATVDGLVVGIQPGIRDREQFSKAALVMPSSFRSPSDRPRRTSLSMSLRRNSSA